MTYRINELWHGDIFTYGGISWAFLAHEEKGGRVLSVELQGEKPFDEGESKDWREASIKTYMTGDLLKQIIDGGADERKIIEADVDLTAVNGATDYGKDPCKIAPMTEAVYMANKSAIPSTAATYWLVTPYSHEESYVGGAYMHQVRTVRTDGSVEGCAADGGVFGVRPCCVLDKETEVDVTSSEIDDEIAAILAYDNPIVINDGITDLAEELKSLIRMTAAKCENIPAVQDLKPTEAETYSSETAVSMYQTIRSAAVTGTLARTDMTVLVDKL